MGKKVSTSNKGFSLIELIIVIAIISIMAGAAMVTVAVMHSAKAKEAGSTFDIEVAQLQANARGKMVVVEGVDKEDYRFAICVYRDGGKYYMKNGYYKGTGSKTDDANYDWDHSDNVSGGKGTSLSSYVIVKYIDPATNVEREIGNGAEYPDQPVYIIFNRQGECVHGNGTYTFYRKSGDQICDVKLNRIGSRQTTY